jgi:pyruvate formate lyase activating enzyme
MKAQYYFIELSMLMSQALTLREILKTFTIAGDLYDVHEDGSVVCYACGHRCLIRPDREGICRVRFNQGGKLYVPANYAAGIQCDPTEKKPFFHAYPGSLAVTFGMLGCDYHCSYCQNWLTSQALRDPKAVASPQEIRPIDLIILGKRYNAKLLVSSYNEPLITSEWAMQIFEEAKKEGFVTGYVSNGNATEEVLDYIRPHTDLYKIDLKSFSDKTYRKLGGVLNNVLQAIEMVYERGFWLEVVSLLIPGFNDTTEELMAMAKYLVGISADIPWHVTAFHQEYKMESPENTPVETLIRAAEVGYEAGLNFVYAGNLPGQVRKYENTHCPQCGYELVRRCGFQVLENKIVRGSCSRCLARIPGVWSD